jgi:methionyl-tRNA formyltransferase
MMLADEASDMVARGVPADQIEATLRERAGAKPRLRIAVFGMNGDPATYYMTKAIEDAGVEIAALYLDARPVSEKDLRIWAQRTAGRLPGVPLDTLRTPRRTVSDITRCVSDMERDRIDLVVNASIPRMVSPELLSRVPILNVHPGELPRYRGSCAVEWALYHGYPVCNTVHLMVEELDAGPTLTMQGVSLHHQSNYAEVRTGAYVQGWSLLAQTLKQLIAGKLLLSDAKPQDHSKGKTYKPMDEQTLNRLIEAMSRPDKVAWWEAHRLLTP